MPRGALDIAHVPRQLSELPELRKARPAHISRGIPRGVVGARFRCCGQFLLRRRLRLQDFVAALHVWIDRLARDEEMLNLARAFEDAVDAHVAQDALDRIALLAASAQ